jgi:DNA primase
MRTDSPKEEIRRRVDLVALVSRYVALQRSGRRFRGRCPFHQERHPSFYVDPATGLWKCFGCGAAGDVFTFVQRLHNLSFAEAAEQLGAEVGVEWRPGGGEEPGRSLRQAILRANDLALRFFVEQLIQPWGEPARAYLAARGFSEAILAQFEIGYAPADAQALPRYLAARGFRRDLLAQAGLVRGDGAMFVQRIIFPVRDVAGRVIAFGGRALDENDPAKYLNSPDTPVFHKGETLYGLPAARAAATARGELIIVEGYTDVLALHQAGITNVVACLGTALTADHLRVAGRYVDQVVLAYDADAAGLQAALRDISMFERSRVEVKIALLPTGHDPDSLVRAAGKQAFVEAVQQARPAVECKLRQVLAEAEQADRKQAALRAAAEVLLEVSDRTRRLELLDRVADWWGQGDPAATGMMRRALLVELERRARGRPEQPSSPEPDDQAVIVQTVAQTAARVPAGRLRLERTLLSWALTDPALASRVVGELGVGVFCDPAHRAVAEAVARQLQRGEFKPDALPHEVGEDPGCREVLAELLLADPALPTEEEFVGALQKLRMLHLCGAAALRWEQAVAEASTDELPVSRPVDVERLRRQIAELLDRGEITAQDPLYQEYCRLVAWLHGRRGSGFYEAPQRRRPCLWEGPGPHSRRDTRQGGKA